MPKDTESQAKDLNHEAVLCCDLCFQQNLNF